MMHTETDEKKAKAALRAKQWRLDKKKDEAKRKERELKLKKSRSEANRLYYVKSKMARAKNDSESPPTPVEAPAGLTWAPHPSSQMFLPHQLTAPSPLQILYAQSLQREFDCNQHVTSENSKIAAAIDKIAADNDQRAKQCISEEVSFRQMMVASVGAEQTRLSTVSESPQLSRQPVFNKDGDDDAKMAAKEHGTDAVADEVSGSVNGPSGATRRKLSKRKTIPLPTQSDDVDPSFASPAKKKRKASKQPPISARKPPVSARKSKRRSPGPLGKTTLSSLSTCGAIPSRGEVRQPLEKVDRQSVE